MVESEIKNSPEKKVPDLIPEFPKLYLWKDEAVILMTSIRRGLCVKAGSKTALGVESQYWDIHDALPLEGDLVMRNKK